MLASNSLASGSSVSPEASLAPPSPWALGSVAGAGLTLGFLLTALLALVWLPHDPGAFHIADKLQGPSLAHPLGTDHLGRDELSLLMAGASTSGLVALGAVVIGLGGGVPLGLLAAARRGSLDLALMRVNDVLFAFPALLLAVLLAAALGPGLFSGVLAIGLFNIPVFARLSRAQALGLWQKEYVLAARVAGKGAWRISLEHLLPNLAPLLLVQACLQFSLGILAEAALSFIGLGAQPPTPSWGRMLADAQTLTALAPRLALLPGIAIVGVVLGLNLLGDGLQTWMNPRRARRQGGEGE